MIVQDFNHKYSLLGKVALVTGASSGIGNTIAKQLNLQGASLILQGRKFKEKIHSSESIEHNYIECDLLDESEFSNFQKLILEFIPDIIVLNANPRVETNRINRLSTSSYENLNTSFKFLLPILHKILETQRKRKFGRWIGISSIHSKLGAKGRALYMMQKKLLESFCTSIAIEESKYGITSNLIQVGFVVTESILKNYSQNEIERYSKMNLIGREGTEEEIASLVSYLTTQQASFITGAKIPVTGGYELGWAVSREGEV
ncbi:MAG: SDR family oxidoreductase [Leptospiraceae bacterium]|nr:SDR family oxidoreductase [Leptospiraceae bacterium]